MAEKRQFITRCGWKLMKVSNLGKDWFSASIREWVLNWYSYSAVSEALFSDECRKKHLEYGETRSTFLCNTPFYPQSSLEPFFLQSQKSSHCLHKNQLKFIKTCSAARSPLANGICYSLPAAFFTIRLSPICDGHILTNRALSRAYFLFQIFHTLGPWIVLLHTTTGAGGGRTGN